MELESLGYSRKIPRYRSKLWGRRIDGAHYCNILSLAALALEAFAILQTMSSAQKRRLFPFPRRQQGSSSTPDQRSESVESNPIIPASDQERTRERYLKAMSLLEDALKGHNEKGGNFEIPKLEGELENVNSRELKEMLESLCQSYDQKRSRNGLGKCAHAIECFFTAFAPFAKNFLSIAKEGAQVISCLTHFPDLF